MIDSDSKKLKEAEWTQKYTLTQEQTKQLILNKFRRAGEMHNALSRREIAQEQLWTAKCE